MGRRRLNCTDHSSIYDDISIRIVTTTPISRSGEEVGSVDRGGELASRRVVGVSLVVRDVRQNDGVSVGDACRYRHSGVEADLVLPGVCEQHCDVSSENVYIILWCHGQEFLEFHLTELSY